MRGSNRPQVLGLVSMIAATSGPSLRFQRIGIDMAVSASPGTSSTVKPASAAVAGLVPCAEDGTRMRRALLAARFDGRADREQAAQFAMRAGLGRHRHGRHAGQRGQPAHQFGNQLQRALHRLLRLRADGDRRSPAAAPSSR